QTAFFSSTTTLFDKYLENSRMIANDKLGKRGDLSTNPFKNDILPNVDGVSFPGGYILPNISEKELLDKKFNIRNFKGISDQVQAFLIDLHKNLHFDEGTEVSETDALVNNLLVQIVGLHRYPLKVRWHPRCRLYIASEAYMTAKSEFIINNINKENFSLIVVE
ncbi:23655_t:CDS:2, partial [Dentiscutata erythropus]